MAKRSIRKMREQLPAPSFKERAAAGRKGPEAVRALWLSYGIAIVDPHHTHNH